MPDFSFRPIRPEDNAAVAAIIRAVMPAFGAGGPGFAIHDAEVDRMAEAYAAPGAAYFAVVDDAGRVVGGGGFAKLEGGEDGVCELKKMYFLPEARGAGMGERLLRHCLNAARQAGYRTMYLETLTGMGAAMKLYAKVGFKPLCAPMGATGHTGCDRWYAMKLRASTEPIRITMARGESVIFGDSEAFLIESKVEIEPNAPATSHMGVCGRIRLHLGEYQVGDFDESCYMLGPISGHLLDKADPGYEAWDASLADLTPAEIFARLDLLLFAYDHGSKSLVDPYSVPDAPEELKHCGFLTNSSEAFDGWKSFLLTPPGQDLLVLIQAHADQVIRNFRIPKPKFIHTVRQFEHWLNETRSALLGHKRLPGMIDS